MANEIANTILDYVSPVYIGRLASFSALLLRLPSLAFQDAVLARDGSEAHGIEGAAVWD